MQDSYFLPSFVTFLISEGANPSARDSEAMKYAVTVGLGDIVNLLINHGVDVNAKFYGSGSSWLEASIALALHEC